MWKCGLFFRRAIKERKMKEIKLTTLTGERALFGAKDVFVQDTVFCDGESPLKESSNIKLKNVMFRWKYPLWYVKNVQAEECTWFDMARAGVWYTEDVSIRETVVQAPKNFRRCKNLKLENVTFTNAEETLWHNSGVEMKNVTAKGNYFAMDSDHMKIDNLTLDGNYSFDGVKDVEISNSRLITKDAFWNSENVTARNCFITGEYLGWNSKNLTLIDCTIESLQGMCYCENLKMINCRLFNTTLAFEYSSVDADLTGRVEDVFNPASGVIRAEEIGTLIMEKDLIDPAKTEIVCPKIGKTEDIVEWRKEK